MERNPRIKVWRLEKTQKKWKKPKGIYLVEGLKETLDDGGMGGTTLKIMSHGG